jgi:DNA/RNA endonuclease YhcR with UshA esterase domain
MRKKTIFFVGIILCLLAAGIAYYLYQKPRTSLANVSADYALQASDLFNQFQQNEAGANKEYLNKIISVKGAVQSVQQSGGNTVIVLDAGPTTGGINCSMVKASSDATSFKAGDSIQIKGRCTGFLMDVNITDAVIEK